MKTKQEFLAELFTTCVELTDDDFTVFCHYYGHTQQIDVSIHPNGWHNGSTKDYDFSISTDGKFVAGKCLAIADEVRRIKIQSIAARDELLENESLRKAKRKEELLAELKELES